MATINFVNPDLRVGFHISKLPTLYNTFDRMMPTALSAFQTYISSGRMWQPPKPNIDDIRMTRALLERNSRYACVHGCLLYNLAGATDHRANPNYQRNLNNTCTGLLGELDVATGFNAGVVVHVGSCKDRKRGIFTISRTVSHCLKTVTPSAKMVAKGLEIPIDEYVTSRKIILENAAGEGSKIGSALGEIAEIISMVDEDVRGQVKVCIDTAHIFGAGQYDMGDVDSVHTFFDDFDTTIGLDRLELFHLNDSRVPFGSKKDRHENLGLGYIFSPDRDDEGDGTEGLRALVDRAERLRIPLVGEPPAKTRDKTPGPGGFWDYAVLKGLCNLGDEFVCD